MYKLMIKTHNTTRLKYLCVTQNEDHDKYSGSGVYWKNHIKEHGKYDVTTEVIFSTECKDELHRECLKYSALYDVVESNEWANLIPESGYDYDGVTRNGWFGWYNSLTEKEIIERNKNISKKVQKRYSTENKEKISEEQRRRRLNISKESAEVRKKKIQDVYNTGIHDHLFERYSKERQGFNNPAAKKVSIEGVIYECIKDACNKLNLTRSVISNRLNSDSNRWKEWKRL